ncbi:hypothetical protein HK099_008646, partial [Clydaea vesicula]
GKKFDKVSRITAKNDQEMELRLDVNTEIYPLKITERLNLLLTNSLSLDPTIPDNEMWRLNSKSIADDYEYVMHGKCYKFHEIESDKVYVN